MSDQIEQPAAETRHYVRRSLRPRRTMRDRLGGLPAATFWVAAAAAVVLLVALLGVGADAALSAGRIHPGVRVGGVEVGGKRPADARAALERELGQELVGPVTLTRDADHWTLAPAKVSASIDYDGLVQQAMAVGRREAMVSQRLSAWFGGVDIPARVSVDDAALAKALRPVERAVEKPARNAGIVVEGTDITVTPPSDGVSIDQRALHERLEQAFASTERAVALPLVVARPAITLEQANSAVPRVRKMVSEPVTVSYDKKRWTFGPEEFGGWLAFRAVEATGAGSTIEPYVEPKRATVDLTERLRGVGRPAVDATFRTQSGRVSVVPSQYGSQPDIPALSSALTRALTRAGDARQVPLRLRRLEPKLTTAEARKMGIKERISTYTTEYDPSNTPRVNNIHLLAEAIDGTLVEPGGTFSFNGSVGPRTAEKGYQEANAIVQGKLVPQLGGGVCQVGTTIFNTVFRSGLPVVERHNHSLYISHYPKGRDATVSWDGPDFKFRNETDQWILVAAGYSDSSVTVSLYGTNPGYTVEAQVGEWYDIKPFGVKQVKDPTLKAGAKFVEENGQDGRSVKVKRIVMRNGKVVREDVFTSVYRSTDEVVRVGTKGPKPSTEPTPAPKPTN